MKCQEESSLIAYLDGELDPLRARDVEAHLKDCPECSDSYTRYQKLRGALHQNGVYFKAPESLEDAIHRRIHGNETVKPVAQRRPPPQWLWIAAAACLIAVAAVSLSLIRFALRPSPTQLLAQQVVSSHIRSLMVSHLTDVTSTDQHTVKPWFSGKLDFAPAVKDFAADGFPLVGGRLDYIDNRPVAALLYKHRQHVINLFMWPADKAKRDPQTSLVKGYNVVFWIQADMNYWAVSDLNLTELKQFVQDERK